HRRRFEQVSFVIFKQKTAYYLFTTGVQTCPLPILTIFLIVTTLPEIKEEEKGVGSQGVFGSLRHKNVSWAVVAQFFYIGAQVCILSFLVMYATEVSGVAPTQPSYYAGVAGLAFMLGRVMGTFLMRYIVTLKLLLIYALISMCLTLYVIYGDGIGTLYAMIGIAFFMSIMFPTIFAVGVEGIGADTKSASSLIVMSIVGGAALP